MSVGFEVDGTPVEVRRSRRRSRTVSAYRNDEGTVVVMIPARMSRAEEREWVDTMLKRLNRTERRRRPSDGALAARAAELSRSYLDGLARPDTVRWVTNQRQRWGSCTPADRSIRLSHRLQTMPAWVVDYVLMHELAHLLEASHNATFWSWVDRYPKAERAKGFLEGISHAERSPDTAAEGDPVDGAGPAADLDGAGFEADPGEPDQLF